MKTFIAANKLVLLIFWLGFAVNFFVPIIDTELPWILWSGLAMFAVHALELMVMFKKLREAGHASIKNSLMGLLFGILHWRPLLRG